VRAGARLRALRIKKRLRQQDVGERAAISRSVVSRIERGDSGNVQLDTLIDVARALGARVDVSVTFLGADMDRLLNARHSALHEEVARFLIKQPGWVIAPEVSYSIYRERGVIDILAWHPPTRTLLVIELKTAIVDVNQVMGKIDEKQRLAARIVRERGWNAVRVAAWLIVADSSSNRRTVSNHRTTLRAAFPVDGRSMRAWLRSPVSSVRALSFWASAPGQSAKAPLAAVRRVSRLRRQAA
jgi:transcriptional regulator with XRE-family HTH domain